jgi:UPF0716 protein FxsA
VRWVLAGVLLVPVIELVAAIQVGRQIGAGWTILLLIGLTVLGGTVVRRAAAGTGQHLLASAQEKRVPGAEMARPVLKLVAGLLLVVPGFVTAAVGLVLLLPPVRALAGRRWEHQLARAAADRAALLNRFGPAGTGPEGTEGLWRAGPASPRRPGGVVITGEVISEPTPGEPPPGPAK